MDKIKIFLVEDESLLRNGIKNSIDWEREGYQFVGDASDGELAYPMIIKEKPDILITDIKMPFMDGLELSRLVKEELPDIKILILSGYDEFEYAKQAIRLGVTGYLVKPITFAKLLGELKDVSSTIKKEWKEKDLLVRYSEEMKENTEYDKMRFFGQLLAGEIPMGEVIAAGKKYGINLSAQVYEVILFKFLLDEHSERMSEAFDAVEKMNARNPHISMWRRGNDGWGFVLTAETEEQIQEKTEQFKESLKKIMERWPEIEYFGGVGVPVDRIRYLCNSYREADKACSGRFTHNPNQILSAEELHDLNGIEKLKMGEFGNLERWRGQIGKFLNNGTEEEIENFSEAYMDEIAEENLQSTLMRQYIIMDVFIVVRSFCDKLDITDEQMENDIDELKRAMQTLQGSDEIRKWLIQLLKKAVEVRDEVSGRRYSDIIETAKRQIEKMYMTEEISLNTVSASVGMSPSYFSSVFRKEMGLTFVEYLTQIRMDKAKELLMCSPMKTSEIGYEVGYKDPHYFSYIFKKNQGCSPKEYRARRDL